MITQEELRELLQYNPDTGVFTRVQPRARKHKKGDLAGTITTDGYVHIEINGRTYKAHRLAWLYVTGEWPKGLLDHKDGAKDNNAWGNLREASRSLNGQNQTKAHAHSKTGILGVTPRRGKFVSTINIEGRNKMLGTFDDAELAELVYLEAKAKFHTGAVL